MKTINRRLLLFGSASALLLALALAGNVGGDQTRCPTWADASTRYLEEQLLAGCNCNELDLLANELLARHGRTFSRPDLKDYFGRQPWYKPDPNNTQGNQGLNPFELWNADLLRRYQLASGCRREAGVGSCPIWPATRIGLLTDRELAPCSCRELELLRHEISARHGRIFTDPGLFNYFKAQPWYVPDRNNPSGDKGQNVFERENVIVLGEAFRKRGCAEVKPE